MEHIEYTMGPDAIAKLSTMQWANQCSLWLQLCVLCVHSASITLAFPIQRASPAMQGMLRAVLCQSRWGCDCKFGFLRGNFKVAAA